MHGRRDNKELQNPGSKILAGLTTHCFEDRRSIVTTLVITVLSTVFGAKYFACFVVGTLVGLIIRPLIETARNEKSGFKGDSQQTDAPANEQ